LSWVIIRTKKSGKEAFVAQQIDRLLGKETAWVPCQIITSRPCISRRVTAHAAVSIKELPVVPKLLFVGGPAIHDREVQSELRTLRHVDRLECNAEQLPVYIPDVQIAAFRAEIDRVNTASLALAQKASRRQKAKWRSLKDALLELVDSAKQQMEQAA
jgi:hypothetical protein